MKLHSTGETDSWRAQTEPCTHQDPGERSSDPTRDGLRLTQECPGVSGGSLGQQWPATGLGAMSVAVCAWDLLKEVTIIFTTSTKVQFSSVAQFCLTLCDPMNCSMPGLPVHHQLPEFTQTHIH